MAGPFDIYDEVIDRAQSMENPRLRGSLYTAADTNPDEEAGLHKLSKKTGLPVEALRVDRGAEARRLDASQKAAALESMPAAAEYLANPENAAVSHDDIPSLADIERITRSGFGPRGPVSTLGIATKADQETAKGAREAVRALVGGLKASTGSFNAGLSETGRVAMEATGIAPALRGVSDLTGNETFRNIADAPRFAETFWNSVAEEKRAKTKAGTLPYYLGQAGESLGVSLMSAPFGLAGEGSALGMFGISASGGQEELTRAGYSEPSAALVSVPKKIMEGLTEKIGLDALYQKGKPLLRGMTEFVFKDLLGEEVNTVYNAIADKVTIRPDMTWHDLGQEVVDTAIITGLQGGLQGAAMHGAARGSEYLQQSFEQSRRTRAAVQMMEALGEATTSSKTYQRLPEKLKELVSRVTEDGPVKDVYVPADAIRELFQGSPETVEEMLGDPSSYYQALEVGGDVVIPLPEYVEKWAGTEYHQALLKDLRLHPGDMTQRELEEWGGRMPEEFDAVLKDLDAQEKAAPSDRKVYDALLGELLGVGRDRSTAERESLLWQSRYRTRAERLGKDAWELYQENPVRIRRPMPEFMSRRDFVDTEIDPFLERLRAGDIPSEKQAFGDSLGDFLRMKGVQDEGGELASLGVDEALKPFQRKMVQESGLPVDKAREAAVEAGYLAEGSTVSDFLDLIDQDARKGGVYSTVARDESAAGLRADLEDLRRYLDGIGVDVSEMSNEDIRKSLKSSTEGVGYYQSSHGGFNGDQFRGNAGNESDAQAASGDPLQAAADVARRSRESGEEDARTSGGLRSAEERALREYAELNDLLLDSAPIMQKVTESDISGTDNYVYEEGGRFYKINRFTHAKTFLDLFTNITLHNSVFGDSVAYRLEGFTEVDGHLLPVFSQPEVKNDLADDPKEAERLAAEALVSLGFTREDGAFGFVSTAKFVNGDVVVRDINSRNVAVQNGEVFFFDPVIELKPEARTEENVRTLFQGDKVDTSSEAFKEWFGDSVVTVDGKQGSEPLVVYHGSGADILAFDVAKAGTGRGGDGEKAIFFSRDVETANHSADVVGAGIDDGTSENGGVVYPAYLRLENPYVSRLKWYSSAEMTKEVEKAKAEGHDGMQFPNLHPSPGETETIAVFHPEQIKSVFNRGTWDGSDPRILYQQTYAEGKRGSITFRPELRDIALLEKADLSTFLHESGHAWLEELFADKSLPDAPDQVRQDWETIAAWGGIAPDASTITVEAHEKFARAVEAYLMEGNAPSVELQPAFQRFKAWLMRIYRELSNLKVDLTDDVRRVLDRLLATDEEIARAEQAQGFAPLFVDAAAAGMTEREFEAYRKEAERAHVEAETRLQQKLMSEITREQKAWWKEEREKVLKEIQAEAEKDPVYLAFQVLTTGKDFEGNDIEEMKISKAALVDRYGKDFVKKLPRAFRYIYTAEGGLHPDEIGELFGFSSGDEMVRKMANAPPMKRYVETETDFRMREVYGDMLNDGTIADEALKAIHSDYQGQVLRAELRALKRKEREVSPYVKAAKGEASDALKREKAEREYERRWMDAEKKLAVAIEKGAADEEIRELRESIRTDKESARRERLAMEAGIPPLEAFKMWAAQTIGAKQVRAIQPGIYARAEQSAGKEAFAAAAKGQYDKAGEMKQRQLLNHYLYLEAVTAKEEAEKVYDYARRLEKTETQARLGKAGGSYLDQINAILERYEFKKQTLETLSNRESLRAWIESQIEQGLEPAIPEEMIDDVIRRNYKELTIDELRAVRDALKNIEHLARESNRIRIENEELELEDALAELAASVADNFEPKKIPLDRETRSWIEKQGDNLTRLDASLLKTEQLVEWMDGGAINGPWARMIFRPIAAAEAKEHDLTLRYTTKLSDIFVSYGEEKRKGMMERIFIPSLNESITKQAAIAAALNTGNTSNLTKLLEGHGWEEEHLDEILSHLDGEDWSFVQSVWDTIEELWPEISALEKRVTGVVPPKVTAREFTNAFGTWRGGYYPVVYDAAYSAAGEKQEDAKGDRLFDSTYVRATTEKGHTKARIESAAYPILLSLEVIPQHMAQVVHDLTHREAVVTANRLLQHKDMRKLLNETIGAPYYRMLKLWLANVANDRNIDRTGVEFWTRFLSGLRTNATIVGMGFRITTMITQVVGLSQSLDIVKGKHLAKAFQTFASHPIQTAEWVAEKSGEMRHRRNSLDRDIRDGIRKLMGKHGPKAWVQAKAFAGIGYMDAVVSIPTWLGAYNQALDEGLPDADAVAAGDRAVRLSQGSGGAKDLAAVQRSSDVMKLFTMFYSYFSVLYNRLRNMGRLKGMGELTYLDVAWKSFIMVLVPAIMGDLIVGRGPDDDEDKAWWALRKILTYPFLTVPFLRDMANAWESGRDYQLTPLSRGLEMAAKLPAQVEAVGEGKKDLSDLMIQTMDLPGYAFGLPTGQVRTTTKYLWNVMDGDVQADDIGDVMKGLLFGHKKGGKR